MPMPIRSLRTACLSAGVLLATIVGAAPADASVIYTYTGNRFTNVVTYGPTTPTDPYTRRDRVKVVFELDTPLAPDLDAEQVLPLSFRFTDGVNTISSGGTSPGGGIFTTDGAGRIVQWIALAYTEAPTAGGGTRQMILTANYADPSGPTVMDLGGQMLCGPASTPDHCAEEGDPFFSQTAGVANNPSEWRMRERGVPEPSSMLLIGTALAGVVARRRGARRS